MKSNTIRFTKNKSFENKYYKNNNLILLDFTNIIIYNSYKKKETDIEYFIWPNNQIKQELEYLRKIFIDGIINYII